MDKKTGNTCDIGAYLKWGFWAMIVLFVLNIGVSFLGQPVIGYVVEVLLYLSALFVFVTSILYLSPSKGFAILALIFSSILFLAMLLIVLGVVMSAASAGLVR